jgi:hypothetical protein
VTSFDVTATINGTPNKKSFAGSLAQGAKTTIDWGEIAYTPTGSYSISISGFENINGGTLYDMDFMNNASNTTGFGFTNNAFTTVTAGFNNATMPTHFAFDQTVNSSFSIIFGTTTKYGANSSNGAVRFPLHSNWGFSGLAGDIVFGVADLSALTKPILSYFYAYSDDAYGGTAPQIKVYVSENCGTTWTEINSITCVQTGAPATHGNWYVPASSEYIWVGVPLTAYLGKSILVKISGIPGTSGNAMYIDEPTISNTASVSEFDGNIHFAVYPNPVLAEANVEYALTSDADVTVSVYNSLSQLVYTKQLGKQAPGTHNATVETNNLESGMYIMKISAGNNVSTQKFVKN